MTDQLPIDQLLVRLRREAAAFNVPTLDGSPRRADLEDAATAADGARTSIRVEALEAQLASVNALLEDLRAAQRAQATAIALQQDRVTAIGRIEADIRVLREGVRTSGAVLASLSSEARDAERRAEEVRVKGAKDVPDPDVPSAPLGELAYWPRLLLLQGDDFLKGAYRVLLDRDIDSGGLDGYRAQLAAGRGALEVLCDITLSDEFQRRGVDDGGLRTYRGVYKRARRLERMPLLRFLSRLPRGRLQRAESSIRASLAAEIALAARDHVNALAREARARGPLAAAELATDPCLDAFYLAFEDAMRGPEDEIRAGLTVYLDAVAAATQVADGPVLDLGCGRGEWLSLLRDSGHAARGVDISPTMVELCRARGHDVAVSDALAALRAQPDDSLSVVSGFHIIEHLPFPVLFAVFAEARRVLQPGGLLLFETPNPENLLVGAHTFHHDPTHRNPLTPSSMTFLAEFHGFGDIEIVRQRPYPHEALVEPGTPAADRLNCHLYGPQDYAILARKRSGTVEAAG